MVAREPYFYIDLNCLHSMPYVSSNGMAETASRVGELEYELRDVGIRVKLNREDICGYDAYRQSTTAKNISDRAETLDTLSSAFVCGIGKDGSRRWHEDRFVVHYAYSSWMGEAQWRHEDIHHAGLFPTGFNTQTSIRLQSYGSWSTQKYYPLILLEDKDTKKTWFFEHEGGMGWEMDISVYNDAEGGGLCVFISDSHEKNDGWYRELAPGEEFTTGKSLVGCVDGGFEEAVGVLTCIKREGYMQKLRGGVPPLCFNDYMNCLWALPARWKLEPLIAAASRIGCEYFVIDAGWFYADNAWGPYIGDWDPDDGDALFGEGGLCGIIEDIRRAGMLPGVWLEMESVGTSSRFAKAHPECLLTRHGRAIGSDRCLADFKTAAVREHLRSVIDRLYKMGVRYIKNDYNLSTGVGVDGERPSLADNLAEHNAAVMSFYDEIQNDYSDLVIESCSSGAMRCDFGTVKHFAVQSVSDQDNCYSMPSILSGMSACLPPERVGIWSFPYPLEISRREIFKPNTEFTAKFSDGRETVYNMVSGLMGCFYLSGHIDCADEFNMGLMQCAAETYKRNRALICRSVPIYPCGTFDMRPEGIRCFGLKGEGFIMLAVWSMDDTREIVVDLSKYAEDVVISEVYPPLPEYCAESVGHGVRIRLPEGRCAMWVKLSV